LNRTCREQRGFALVLTLWGLGLISLLVMAVVIGERYRILSARNILEYTKAQALAQAGANRAREKLVNVFSANPTDVFDNFDGQPRLCQFIGKGIAVIAVQSEAGKIDINTASPDLLDALLRGFGADFDEAHRLAAAIRSFGHSSQNESEDAAEWTEYLRDHRTYGPKKAPFESIFELDQVVGMHSDLLARILPYLTVYSHLTGVNPNLAAPELLAALAGRPRSNLDRNTLVSSVPSQFLTNSVVRTFTIHVEVRTVADGRSSVDVIVEPGAGNSLDVIREWYRSDARLLDYFKAANYGLPAC
jgi:general secretion pathway protein K